uniref:NTF2 domain-containing protein n=1 Tax=Dendroctonus ponderosae TaxID=77166 RepID=A0AAR5Q5L7_DENPD
MVMEAPPSPQSVGREFVRQYYTLLNRDPSHQHRFFNHLSSFIHGGLEPNRETNPIIGQKQIHLKIQQLHFRDCHAKITQVDSQSTLGGGVVVQVSGELSNAGEPMRRFTQTFVLALQSPKKYYVHNDIFRYQDEIITDEDCDGDMRGEVAEERLDRQVLGEAQGLTQPIAPAPVIPYYGGAVPPAGTALPSLPAQPSTVVPHQPIHVLSAQPQVGQLSQTASLNGHPDDLAILQGHLSQSVPQPLSAPLTNMQNQVLGNQSPVIPQVEEVQEQDPVEEPVNDEGYGDSCDAAVEQEVTAEPASNEPKTYANLLKTSSGQSQSIYQAQPSPSVYRPQSPPTLGNRDSAQTNGLGNKHAGPRISTGPPNRSGGPNHNRGPRTGDEEDRRRFQSSNFGGQLDANQLFLGNLPHSATDDELREIFGKFGTVVDLRVHSKPATKGPKVGQSRLPPNYGFITYDSQQSVMACLAAKPIFYPRNDPNGTKMNVEEKKNKERDGNRPSYGVNSRPGMDNRSGGRSDAQRRGMGPGGLRGIPGGPQGTQGPGDRNRTGDRDNRYNNRSGGGPANRGGPNNYQRRQ